MTSCDIWLNKKSNSHQREKSRTLWKIAPKERKDNENKSRFLVHVPSESILMEQGSKPNDMSYKIVAENNAWDRNPNILDLTAPNFKEKYKSNGGRGGAPWDFSV